MPARQLAETSLNFSAAAASAVHDAAARSGLDPGDARLIRLFGTAVYHLPAARAVARVALVIPGTVTRLATSVQITRWLAEIGFPAVEPLPVGQPVTSNGCAVTFWHYLPQEGAEPAPADLGRLLRQLHQLDPPPVFVPAYRRLSPSARPSTPAKPSGRKIAPGCTTGAPSCWPPTTSSASRCVLECRDAACSIGATARH